MFKTKKAEIIAHIHALNDNIVRRYGLETKAAVEWFMLAEEFEQNITTENDPKTLVTLIDKTYYSFIELVENLTELRMENGD